MISASALRHAVGMNIVTILVCGVGICAGDAGAQDVVHPRAREVRIKGTICDTSGTALSGVTVKVSTVPGGTHEPRRTIKTLGVTANSSYNELLGSVVEVGVNVQKDGYYNTGYWVTLYDVDKMTSVVEGVQTIERNIMLQPVEAGLPALTYCEDELMYADGQGYVRVIPCDGRKCFEQRCYSVTSGTMCVEKESGEADRGTTCATVGVIASWSPRPAGGRAVWGNVRIGMDDGWATDGLQLCKEIAQPRQTGRRLNWFPVELREAPVDGYLHCVSIPCDTVEELCADSKKAVYLWVRCRGKYGKLAVKGLLFADWDNRVVTDIGLYMQPDGSRDLRSLTGASGQE